MKDLISKTWGGRYFQPQKSTISKDVPMWMQAHWKNVKALSAKQGTSHHYIKIYIYTHILNDTETNVK